MSFAEDNGHDMPREPWQDEEERENEEVAFTKLVAQTDRAWLLRFDSGKKEWFPMSRCTIETDERPGGMLCAPAWILDEKGIHYGN